MRSRTLGMLAVAAGSVTVVAPAMAAPPANDAFGDSQNVQIGQEYSGSLAEATGELGEPRHGSDGPHHSAWFRFRARHSGRLTIDTGGSNFDSMLAVYTGSDLSSLRLVASDDDSSPSGDLGSTVRFQTRRGRTYRIAVDTYHADAPSSPYKLWLSDGGINGKGVRMAPDAGQSVDSVRSRGLRLNVSARRRTGVAITLRVSRSTASRVGLDSRVLGRARGVVDYNQALPAVIRLTRAARTALDGEPSLQAEARLKLLGSTAPDRVLIMPVAL